MRWAVFERGPDGASARGRGLPRGGVFVDAFYGFEHGASWDVLTRHAPSGRWRDPRDRSLPRWGPRRATRRARYRPPCGGGCCVRQEAVHQRVATGARFAPPQGRAGHPQGGGVRRDGPPVEGAQFRQFARFLTRCASSADRTCLGPTKGAPHQKKKGNPTTWEGGAGAFARAWRATLGGVPSPPGRAQNQGSLNRWVASGQQPSPAGHFWGQE